MLYCCAKALLNIRMGYVTLKDGVIVLYANSKVLLCLGLECSVVQIEEVC